MDFSVKRAMEVVVVLCCAVAVVGATIAMTDSNNKSTQDNNDKMWGLIDENNGGSGGGSEDEVTKTATLLHGGNPSYGFPRSLHYHKGDATKVAFVRGKTVPNNVVTTDYSEAGDRSILGWKEGDTYYISSASDTKIMANANSAVLFCDFYSGLTEIDLSNFDTSNVTNMGSMFRYCYDLTTIKGIEKLNTSNVTHMGGMFRNCTSLLKVDITKWDMSNVVNKDGMFDNCPAGKDYPNL